MSLVKQKALYFDSLPQSHCAWWVSATFMGETVFKSVCFKAFLLPCLWLTQRSLVSDLSLTYTASERDPGLTQSHAHTGGWGFSSMRFCCQKSWSYCSLSETGSLGCAFFSLFSRMHCHSELLFSESWYSDPHPQWHMIKKFLDSNTCLEATEERLRLPNKNANWWS